MLPTSSSARTGLPAARTLAVVVCALLGAGVALAGPAAAIDDPRRPWAEVTAGPSCGPGVVRTLVTNGTEAHRVGLVFDSTQEQDSALLAPGEQVELVSGDVDWGVTVDVSVTVADPAGTAEDPLELSTYTRPSAEDCAAVTAPPTTGPSAAPTPSTTPSTDPPEAPPTSLPTPASSTRPTSAPAPTPAVPRPGTPSSSPRSSSPASSSPGSTEPDRSSGTPGGASAASVSRGGVVTVRATGFTPGELVTIGIAGLDEPLTTVPAAADGSVEAVVQIPRSAALGTASVQFVGGESAATAGLDLQVAARTQPVPERTGSPAVLAAGLALIGAAGALGLVGARRSRGRHGTPSR